MRRLILLCLALATVVATTTSALRPAVGQEVAASYRFIPSQAVAALVAYPKRALEAPGTELYPREVISAAGLQSLGLDPLDVEQLVAFVEAPSEPGPPPFGVVLRMAKPQDRQKLLPMLLEGATAATLQNGKPFLRAAQPFLPSVMLPNDRTIVIAPEATLEKMTAAAAYDSPLLKLLRAAPTDRQLLFIATLDPIRELIQGAVAATPPLPPPFERFKQLPDHVKSIELRANLTVGVEAELILRAADADSATQLGELLENGVAIGKEAFLAQIAARPTNDPVEQATGRYAQRMAEHFAQMLQPQIDGTAVKIALKGDTNVATSGVLVGLLLPAVQSAREAASRTSAANNLKQIGLAMHNFHDTNNRFPPPAVLDQAGKPLLSWRVAVLPYLGRADLYDQFKRDEPWDSEHNRKLIEKMPEFYLSPGMKNEGKTRYLAATGEGALFSVKEGPQIRQVVDGTSNTIMAVEAAENRAVIWTKPDDLAFDPQRPLEGLIGARAGGFQAVFTDGAVRFIAQTIDLNQLKALFTYRGGEVVGEF